MISTKAGNLNKIKCLKFQIFLKLQQELFILQNMSRNTILVLEPTLRPPNSIIIAEICVKLALVHRFFDKA